MPNISENAVESFIERMTFRFLGVRLSVAHNIHIPQLDRATSLARDAWTRFSPWARPTVLVGGGMLAALLSPYPRVLGMVAGQAVSFALTGLSAQESTPAVRAVGGVLAGLAIGLSAKLLPVVGFGLGVWGADAALRRAAAHGALSTHVRRAGVAAAYAQNRLGPYLGLPEARAPGAQPPAARTPLPAPGSRLRAAFQRVLAVVVAVACSLMAGLRELVTATNGPAPEALAPGGAKGAAPAEAAAHGKAEAGLATAPSRRLAAMCLP